MYVLLIIEHNGDVFILFIIIILHAPLLWSNTTCIGGFVHNLN